MILYGVGGYIFKGLGLRWEFGGILGGFWREILARLSEMGRSYSYIVINLARSVGRRDYMEGELGRAGLLGVAEFFAAVDGESLRGDGEVMRLSRRARYVHRRGLSYGEVGCVLSHCGVWRRLLADSEHEHYVVLEDDSALGSGLDEVVGSLVGGDFGISCDFVRLQVTQYVGTHCVVLDDLPRGYKLMIDYGPDPEGGVFGVGLTNTTGVLKDWLLGLAGYVISKEGARRLLAHTESYTRPPDVQLSRFWEYGLPPLVVHPAIVETANEMPSTLGRIARENYAAPPFSSYDLRHQASRVARTFLRRRDVWRYRRFVSELQEKYGKPDYIAPPTFRYDSEGFARFIARDNAARSVARDGTEDTDTP
ncbi:MAG: glycosyltransferase family 25 protein [Alphaproteobacteria bacterium]